MESIKDDSNAKFDALVLSGGSTKTIFHLGVLHYYYEKKVFEPLSIKEYAGTSAGSIINLLLICGYLPIEIFNEVYALTNLFSSSENNIWDLFQYWGLLSIDPPIKLVEDLVIKKLGYIPTLSKLRDLTGKTLIAPAVNMTKKCLVYFSPETHPNLRCTDLCKLSSKLPLIFQRVSYNGDYYEDGGLADNFPTSVIPSNRNVLAIYVTGSDLGGIETFSFVNYLYSTIMFPINTNTKMRSKTISTTGRGKLIGIDFKDEHMPVVPRPAETARKMFLFMTGYKEAEREERSEKLYIEGWNLI